MQTQTRNGPIQLEVAADLQDLTPKPMSPDSPIPSEQNPKNLDLTPKTKTGAKRCQRTSPVSEEWSTNCRSNMR